MQANSLSCRIEVLNRTNWAAWPPEAQAIIAGAGRQQCWPHCPPSTPSASPPCPVAPPPLPPGPPPAHLGVAVCNVSRLSQRWLLSPGVKVGSSLPTNIMSAIEQHGGCIEITGCAGSSIGTSYGCKPLPKPGTAGMCPWNGVWLLNNNRTITSVMDGQCLQLSAGVLNTAPCNSGAPSPPSPPKGPRYIRLPVKESCHSGTTILTTAECANAFTALRSTLPPGAKDNTKCCNGTNLPFGCTYRTDNDFVFNGDASSPASYAAGGWRAVCSTTPHNDGAAIQLYNVTVVNSSASGDEVMIQPAAQQIEHAVCVDNQALV